MDNIKLWIARNKKLTILILIVFAVFIAGSAVRCSFVQSERAQEIEIKNQEEGYCELTSQQSKIFEGYDKNTSEIVDFLKNSKWVDNSGNKALFFRDKYFIERANEKENSASYVICSVDEEKTKISSAHTQTIYRLTIMTENGDYVNAELTKVATGDNSSSALVSANIKSDKLFNNATIYNRINNVDNFAIDDWDDNASQFIQGNYDGMYSCIKDYCAKYYPQIASVSWSSLVTIDYQTHQITYPFTIKTNNYYTLNVMYNIDKGTFECSKAKNNN